MSAVQCIYMKKWHVCAQRLSIPQTLKGATAYYFVFVSQTCHILTFYYYILNKIYYTTTKTHFFYTLIYTIYTLDLKFPALVRNRDQK